MQTWALKSSIILFPIVYSLSPEYYNFHSYGFYLSSLNIQICVSQHSRESNGGGLRVVMRITSHNYDNHRQGCQRRHLKSNRCGRRNFKRTNFNLFRATLKKLCTGNKHYTPDNIRMLLQVAKCVPKSVLFSFEFEPPNLWMQKLQTPFQESSARPGMYAH